MTFTADNRPTPYEYALMSQHVYKGKDLKKGDKLPGAKDWKVDAVYAGKAGLFCASYINFRTRQVVVAYRGTDSIAALWEDMVGIYSNKINSTQKLEAFELANNAIQYVEQHDEFQLSFTGHSLGGALASLSAYYAQRSFGYKKVSAFGFETPGVYESMKKLQSNVEQGKVKIKELDIVNCLSYPTKVNLCNHHVGSLYAFNPKLSTYANWSGIYLKSAHTIDNFVELLKNENYPGQYVLDWPINSQDEYYFKHAVFKDGYYILSDNNEDLFEREYFAHVKIDEKHGIKNALPFINLLPEMREWLQEFYKSLNKYQKLNNSLDAVLNYAESLKIDKKIIDILMTSTVIKQQNGLLLLVVADDKNIFTVKQNISEWLEENTNIAEEFSSYIFKLANFIGVENNQNKRPTLEAIGIEGGAEFSESAYIGRLGVYASLTKVPENISEEAAERIKDLENNKLKALKDNDITCRAVGIENGAKFKGKMGVLEVSPAAVIMSSSDSAPTYKQADLITQQRVADNLANPSKEEAVQKSQDQNSQVQQSPSQKITIA